MFNYLISNSPRLPAIPVSAILTRFHSNSFLFAGFDDHHSKGQGVGQAKEHEEVEEFVVLGGHGFSWIGSSGWMCFGKHLSQNQ